VECFGGGGRESLMKHRAGGPAGGANMGGGKLDECIMHQVHISDNEGRYV